MNELLNCDAIQSITLAPQMQEEVKFDEQGNPIVPVTDELTPEQYLAAEAVVQTDADVNP